MPLSTTARQAMFAQETGEAFLVLLAIDHPDLIAQLLFVNNNVNVVSTGGEHIAYPFDVQLPDSDEERDIIARLSIDNVSREIAQVIRSLDTPPTVGITIVRASDPNWPEVELPGMLLRDVTWDALQLSGELSLSDITAEPYPAWVFDPGRFPALF